VGVSGTVVGEELNEDDGEEVEEVEEEEEVEDAAEELEGLLLKELEVSPRIPLSTCVQKISHEHRGFGELDQKFTHTDEAAIS